MKVTFLQAADGSKFAKKITKTGPRTYDIDPYPNIRDMNSRTVNVESLPELANLMAAYAAEGWCMLKGNTKKDLVNESRRGSHDPMAPTHVIVIDWDKLLGIISPRQAAALLGKEFLDATCIYQPSASAHYIPAKASLSGHQVFISKKPLHPGILKAWLIQINLDTPELAEQIELTADGRGLKFKLDVTTCQNDKLIFISPPICKGFKSLVKEEDQFQLIQGSHDVVDLDLSHINVAAIQERKAKKVMELRKLAGLPATKLQTRRMFNQEVITNPDHAMVTDMREQGAFVRLNINNGDSWAYWHPIDNWEVIYSFKDDQAYQASKFVPDYYTICQNAAAERREVKSTEGDPNLRYIAFLDPPSDRYYRGTWDPQNMKLDLHPTSGRDKVDNFFQANNLAAPDVLPEWHYKFAFDDTRFVDFEDGFINKYTTPRIVLDAITEPKKATITEDDFPTIAFIIAWVMAGDRACVDHFYNWLAVKLNRQNPYTAWLFQGTTGTGKGQLFHRILAMLFGRDFVAVSRLQDMTNRFNRFDEAKVLVLVDEADMETVAAEGNAISASLKSLITEPTVPYEGKGQQRRQVPNHCSYIFTSNQPTPVHIEYNDRRFNVAPRQEKPLRYIEDLEEKIETELPFFAQFLIEYEADLKRARTPLINQANAEMRRSGLSSLHEIGAALREGDFEYFVTNLPEEMPLELVEKGELNMYLNTLTLISKQEIGEATKLSRKRAEALFHYLDDKAPTKNKFTTMMKRLGLPSKVMRNDGHSFRGYEIKFKITPEMQAALTRALQTLREEPTVRGVK